MVDIKNQIIKNIDQNENFKKIKTFDNGLILFRHINNDICYSAIVNKDNKIIGYTISRHEKGLCNWAKNV